MTQSSKISRYYLFFGSDEYSMVNRVKSLVKVAIERGFEDFDYDVFDGRNFDIAQLINTASTPPFGSPLRVVHLRNLEKLSPKSLDLLDRFMPKIPERTTLVMTCKKVDKRKKFFKSLFAREENCVGFEDPPPEKAVAILKKKATELGFDISDKTLNYLVETVGCNLGILEQEMVKLSLFGGPDSVIKDSDIALMIGAGASGTIADLPARIAVGDTGGALRLLSELMLSRESEGTILFRIKDYFLKMNAARASNANAWAVARDYHMLTASAEPLVRAARKLASGRLVNCLKYIYEAEIELKSAGLKKEIVLLALVSRLGAEVAGE